MTRTRHISVSIAAPADAVYSYAADPGNMPHWAAGLARSEMQQVDGTWYAESPMGRVRVDFAPPNEFGVLDHTVTLPDGQQVYNPMRVIPDGDACEAVFSLRRRQEMSDADFDADTRAVTEDLATLRRQTEDL